MKKLSNMVKTTLRKENGAAEIIAVIVLVAIALIFAIAFRNEIGDLLSSIWDAVRGREEDLTADFRL